MGQNLNINPRPPGQWVEVAGTRAGQPTPEFYRFIVNLLGLAGGNANLTIDELNALVLTQPNPYLFVTPPVTQVGNTTTAVVTETLVAGAMTNLFDSGGTASLQNANATGLTRPANSFVTSAYAAGQTATVFYPGQFVTGLSALTPGLAYWLGTTNGALATAPPSQYVGHGSQRLGWADQTGTKLFFQPELMVGI